jgi:hypothetical protein
MFLTDKLLFIHIPKSAGSSVVHILENQVGGIKKFDIDIHSTFDQFNLRYPHLVKNRKVFCLVRNPYCRFVSIYRFINRDFKLQKWFGKKYLNIKKEIDTFEKFIMNFVFPEKAWGGNSHFTPQTVWSNNIENVFKVEDTRLVNIFFKQNNILHKLPLKNNQPIPSHTNFMYREFYNVNTKNIIRDKFESDLSKFNYDF